MLGWRRNVLARLGEIIDVPAGLGHQRMPAVGVAVQAVGKRQQVLARRRSGRRTVKRLG